MNHSDYDDRFPPEDERREFESLALDVAERFAHADAEKLCVERTRDAIQITLDFGEHDGCVLILTPDLVDIRLPRTDWLGPHNPVASSVSWRRAEIENTSTDDLYNLIDDAREALKEAMIVCCHCGERFQLEHTTTVDDRQCCHGCASAHHGVVF